MNKFKNKLLNLIKEELDNLEAKEDEVLHTNTPEGKELKAATDVDTRFKDAIKQKEDTLSDDISKKIERLDNLEINLKNIKKMAMSYVESGDDKAIGSDKINSLVDSILEDIGTLKGVLSTVSDNLKINRIKKQKESSIT